jgi:hypothetical protein
MRRRDLSKALIATATGAPLLAATPAAPAQERQPRTASEAAARVDSIKQEFAPGDIRRYGADPTGARDSTTAINDALKCNAVVFDSMQTNAVYKVTGPIRLRFAGQILKGTGMGDTNSTGKLSPRTVLRYAGPAGGKVVSVCDGSINLSETTIQDLCIDGNNRANIGIEGNDDQVAGGCWRNIVRNVAVLNCTAGRNPTCIYLGNGVDDRFSNDAILEGCFIWNAARGLWARGAVYQLYSCTIGLMSDCGIRAEKGSEWKIFGGVFHNNNWDIDTAADLPVQNIMAVGAWFENSRSGIFRAQNSFNLQMIGCHLHTSSQRALLDFGGRAGHASLKSWMAPDSKSNALINTNPNYDYDLVGTGITLDKGYKLRVCGPDGLVRIDNADFLVAPLRDAPEATGDGTAHDVGGSGVVKDHDLSNAIDPATGVFTAPVDGHYEIYLAVELGNLGSGHTSARLQIVVAGHSAQTYGLATLNPAAARTAENEYQLTGVARVYLAKGDTCRPRLIVSNSTRTVAVLSGGPANAWRTRFQGRLA